MCLCKKREENASKQQTLGLPLRRGDDEPVEFVGDLDLARQARVRPHVETEIQHVLFHRRRRADLLAPGFVDIDMAGGAGAGAAAFGFDAGNGVANGGFHDSRAVLDFDNAGFALMVDKVDLGHVCSCCRVKEVRQSYNGSVRAALGMQRPATRSSSAATAVQACATAASSSASACAGSPPSLIAASKALARSATRKAPIARAEPFKLCASAAASGGPSASAPTRRVACVRNIPSTSRSRPASPNVARRRCSKSIGASSAAGDGHDMRWSLRQSLTGSFACSLASPLQAPCKAPCPRNAEANLSPPFCRACRGIR